jgi:N-acetylmuramoyl-L-alanine amidase
LWFLWKQLGELINVRSHWLLLSACSIVLFASPIRAAESASSLRPLPPAPAQTIAESRPTQLEEIRITRDGFFIRTSGGAADIQQDLSRDRRQLTLELDDATISTDITPREFTVDRYGVNRIQLAQDGNKVVITLDLANDVLRWRASAGNRGIVLVPADGLAAAPPDSRVSQSLTARSQSSAPADTLRPSRPSLSELPPGRGRPSRPDRTESAPLPNVADRNVTVAIDPGHGGGDPGAVGIGGLRETDIVLPIALKVTSLLEGKGVRVILTRQADREIELEPRVAQANRARADLFVSIHANAIDMTRPDVNGIETYYYADQSLALAQTLHSSILAATDRPDRRVRQARFYVLRNTAMPAVLLEVGFVTGAEDAALLGNSDYREQMAEAIARGILEYVQANL